ncbi:HAD family hydrolase [Bdellovibrio svalbardensis]|uniref:HAD family hydrolase n=1 Tax=Bdellovibrio svalbardensis TaxID=2972972 RepID=A0ABT6DGJ1_9BACT|nr:HAD family hydrolase [Bdellovibrio svalbardensis]MDG0815619.1 HAD family hydrolase [Bdellovibrio svalbardensis]
MLEALLVNIQRVSSQGSKCLVVFDLDSTLFDVSPRLERILLDFAAVPEFQNRFPEQVALFKDIKTMHSDWGITGALERAGVDDSHPDFKKAIMDFWYQHFFSNEYLQYDKPTEGAVEFVNEVALAGADIAYLTGRDVQRMGVGSEQVLRKWGLPLNDHAHLVLKPHKVMDDAEFKTDWFLGALTKSYQKIYFFENEPVILHLMATKCPQVESYFFESTHSGKAHPPENLPRLMNFLRSKKES